MAIKAGDTGDAGSLIRPSLTLKRRLGSPPDRVYAAWTDSEKIARWFGPAHVIAGSVRAELDIRIGGRYRIGFETQDGEYHEVAGIYREVVPDRKLVFSWAWHSTPERKSQVTVTLQPDGGGTLLTLHHKQLFDRAARDGHEGGWTGTLDKLEKYVA